jgi:hypothetical protein
VIGMNRTEREDISRLARMRAKQAKQEAAQREKVLLAEVEDLLAADFKAQDELWACRSRGDRSGSRR